MVSRSRTLLKSVSLPFDSEPFAAVHLQDLSLPKQGTMNILQWCPSVAHQAQTLVVYANKR